MKYIKFYSPTCVPCKVADSVLESKGIEFEAIDAIANVELRNKFGVRSVPTVVVLDDDGNEIKRAVGLPQIQNL